MVSLDNIFGLFSHDDKDLSKVYVRKCKKFLKELKKQMEKKQ